MSSRAELVALFSLLVTRLAMSWRDIKLLQRRMRRNSSALGMLKPLTYFWQYASRGGMLLSKLMMQSVLSARCDIFVSMVFL